MSAVTTRLYPAGALERIQAIELDLLVAFDSVCRQLGLTYFMDAGTCLGAARHQGFIPWDDDTDVGMPIEDYRRFLNEAPALLPDGISIHTMENTPGYSALWAKLYADDTLFLDEGAIQANCRQSIFLDIFCYVAMVGSEASVRRRLLHMETWQKASYLRHIWSANIPESAPNRGPKVAACNVAHAILSRTTTDEFVRRHHDNLMPTDTEAAIWANPMAMKPFPFPAEVLFDPIELDFCGHKIFGPADPDGYLTLLYGDWHTLPPKEKRLTHTPVVLDFGDGVNVMETTIATGW